jgi:formate dehydrogenase major subunit
VAAQALRQAELSLVLDHLPSEVSERAQWLLPGVSFAERDGTYTNSQGRVQRARKVFRLRGDAREDWRVLQDLGRSLGAWPFDDATPEHVFQRLASAHPAFRDLTYSVLGERGAPLATATANVAVG